MVNVISNEEGRGVCEMPIKMGKRRRRGRKVSSMVDRVRVEKVRTDC